MTASEAYEYISNILPDLQAKGNLLYAQLHAANLVRGEIRAVGSSTVQIDAVYSAIEQDLQKWNEIKNTLEPLLLYFDVSQLGIDFFTLALIGGTLITIATLVVTFYNTNKIDQHSNAIQAIARNVNLSPADREIVNDATSTGWFSNLFPGLGSIGNYLVIGGLIYLGILAFRR